MRGYRDNKDFCPVTALCYAKTKKFYSFITPYFAGQDLKMHELDVSFITDVADGENIYEDQEFEINEDKINLARRLWTACQKRTKIKYL